ncbi:hypothetical protein C8Q74DRAFT_269916 [Fomes fomentarius]|nr:hypothetical protein C8Q74DRAFT_269916 [Fomes fomentarius]
MLCAVTRIECVSVARNIIAPLLEKLRKDARGGALVGVAFRGLGTGEERSRDGGSAPATRRGLRSPGARHRTWPRACLQLAVQDCLCGVHHAKLLGVSHKRDKNSC